MKTVSMPDAAARFAIEATLPPLDLLTYQIHIPSPSNGEPCGVVAGSGSLIGAGIVGGGRGFAALAAWAGAATARTSTAASFRPLTTSPSRRLRGELTDSR